LKAFNPFEEFKLRFNPSDEFRSLGTKRDIEQNFHLDMLSDFFFSFVTKD